MAEAVIKTGMLITLCITEKPVIAGGTGWLAGLARGTSAGAYSRVTWNVLTELFSFLFASMIIVA